MLCSALCVLAHSLKVRHVDAGPEARPSACVIILHGMTGDSGNGFHRFAQTTAIEMPWLKFILPTAKERPMSVGLEEGGRQEVPAWFDVSSLGELMWTSRDAGARQDEEAQ